MANKHIRSLMLAAAMAATASTAQAEVIEKSDHGFVTRDAAEVAVDPRAAWLALISPGKWWNAAHTWSGDAANMTLMPQAGACFCERIPAEETLDSVGLAGSVEHMTVLMAHPDKVLRLRGGLGPLQSEPVDGVLTITLRATDAGTRILWEYAVGGYHRFDQDMIANAVDGVMSEQLLGLVNHLGPVVVPDEHPAGQEPTPAEAAEGETVEPADVNEAGDPENTRPSVEEAFDDLD